MKLANWGRYLGTKGLFSVGTATLFSGKDNPESGIKTVAENVKCDDCETVLRRQRDAT